ncbi:MAG: hypothetical protein M3480_05485 [Verrucomicrobiota bacterium]|nr:hypothetical protein [Verrucomicrobiota bacterium]
MKSLRNSASAGRPSGAKTLSALFLGAVLLAAGFWATTLPAAPAREVKAADLIAAELPENKSLKSASQIEFLSAVCAVVRGRRNSAAVITQTALRLRREAAGEIVGMVLRCVGKVNCEEAGAIVAAASTAEGDLTKITDAAMAKVPNCAEAIREAARRESKASERPEVQTAPEQGALIGTSGGPNEGFDPHEPLNLVCDDGTQRAVRTSQLDEFLRLKPGSFVGPCQATPPSNR